MNAKIIGALLLIMGTSIGGGMLALPIAVAQFGFLQALLLLFLCWLVMTTGALLLLEVNSALPAGSNIISMAKKTLGIPGQILAWMSYLLLLYTLLAGYISGGSDVFASIIGYLGLNLNPQLAEVLFTLIFGFLVFTGMRAVDLANRGLMFGKLGVFILLLIVIFPFTHLNLPIQGRFQVIPSALMILITSFGFASIIPSLREYLQDDLRSLRKVVVLGSFVPLICYLSWITIILKTIDPAKLSQLMSSSHATSTLTRHLNDAIHSNSISIFFGFFSSICMLTAFLGVSIGLFDFLADGLSLNKKGSQRKTIFALTFAPPLLIVMLKPGIYVQALQYAGICCIVLLLLLPTIMAWRTRYYLANDGNCALVPGGKVVLALTATIAIYLLLIQW